MQLIARFTAREGHEDAVRDLLAGYAAVVRADAGTVLFEPSTATERPRDVVVFERYVDEAAFRAHVAAPENAAFNDAVSGHIESGVTLEFLDPLAAEG
jgi:autoinducer 2-degrading protein